MVSTYEMFSPSTRHQAAYGLSQNYGHQTTYAQYTDSINFNSCNAQSIMENGNYPQNFHHNSWSLYAVSAAANNQPRSHLLPVDEWMPNPCSYQSQGIVQFPTTDNNIATYHYQQRNGPELSPADYSLHQSPGHMRVQEKLEQQGAVVSNEQQLENPSSESVVAVSSDGMSGTDSPVSMPLQHVVNQSGNGLYRPQPARSPFEWIRKTSYQQSQPNPGRTRTKDKYRIVYTDHQRLELEKEFHYSRYITIRRKVELASSLNLSERQIKIWFQNRRAKDRRQAKKREELMLKNKDTPVVYQQSNLSLGNLSIY